MCRPTLPVALVYRLPLCVLVGAPREAREKEGSSPLGGELPTGGACVCPGHWARRLAADTGGRPSC